MTNSPILPWTRLRNAWNGWRDAVSARHAYEAIDIETLRDLGLCRSEYESFWTESRSPRMPTRRRLARWH